MENDIINTAIEYTLPLFEKSMTLAAQYSRACGRDSVSAMDINYCMKYSVMNYFGVLKGSMYPEIYEDSSSDEEIEIEEVEEEFSRYEGTESLMNDINRAYDNWESWEPQSPLEKILKKSIDQKF